MLSSLGSVKMRRSAAQTVDSVRSSLGSVKVRLSRARGRGQVESAMGPALQAAFMVVSPIGGKMLLFQSAVPSLGAVP